MAYMKTYCLCYEYTVQSLCSYQENPSALLWFYVTKFVVKKEEPKSVNNNNYLVDRYLYSVTTALVCCKGHFFKEKGGLCTISCDYNRPIVASLSPVRASLRSVV